MRGTWQGPGLDKTDMLDMLDMVDMEDTISWFERGGNVKCSQMYFIVTDLRV